MVRVISISDEVYSMLVKIKGGKSFTEVIKSLASRREDKGNFDAVMKFFGAISDSEAGAMRASSAKFRKDFRFGPG
ncbi:MAG: antitoxin VapB family protein [Candidatus Marsarchaeota archaeon]|jgi:predicted CopG family antitoxin|nr:antitoxin VapB family protein [Candidatus Marsarchaeota archaeon]